MEKTIQRIVEQTKIIDIHTHLFPSIFDQYCLQGIDNLLTYHYLISELFVVCNNINIKDFYQLSIKQQADIIWKELFINRTPISEACRGVLTTCHNLGFSKEVNERNLDSLRIGFTELIQSKQDYIEYIFNTSNIDYVVMTNQIFNKNEVDKLLNIDLTKIPKQFKTSLRIDELIFDFDNCLKFIQNYGFQPGWDGIKDYIRFWYHKLNPEYFMASLPFQFSYYLSEDKSSVFKMNSTNVIDLILVPLAIELNLPIAFKFGTHRKQNKDLKDAGDGLGIACVDSLCNLCKVNKKCKFLATFLSLNNQHQLCVAARNFPNLHIYGCWWYLNNPSLIENITKMRLEMLGLGFTYQHSDSRVLEQLMYKWSHSKIILTKLLTQKYSELKNLNWKITEEEVKRDVNYLLRGSYESFINM